MADWINLAERQPEEGVVVDTKIDDAQGARNEQPMKRQGRLWFVEDGSMYVYYQPTHWRPADPAARAQRLKDRLQRMDEVRAGVQRELDSLGVAPSCGESEGEWLKKAKGWGLRLVEAAKQGKADEVWPQFVAALKQRPAGVGGNHGR